MLYVQAVQIEFPRVCVLSGLPAEEIHVCGHESALPLVRRLTHTMEDELEVRTE